MVVLMLNFAMIFVITLGSPLWDGIRRSMCSSLSSLLSFAFPLRFSQLIYAGHKWNKLGEAQGLMIPVEIAMLVTQTLLFPVFVFFQFVLVFLPVLIISAYPLTSSLPLPLPLSLFSYSILTSLTGPRSYFPDPNRWPSFSFFWDSFFTSRAYWHRCSEFPWWFWLLEAYWALIWFASLHLTFLCIHLFTFR